MFVLAFRGYKVNFWFEQIPKNNALSSGWSEVPTLIFKNPAAGRYGSGTFIA